MIRIQFWAHRCRNRCVRMCVAGWWANREHWLQWWNCLRVHFLIWVLLQDIYDLKCNSAIPNVSSASRWSIANHIFSKVHKWNVNNWHLDIDFNSEICGELYFWKFERSLISLIPQTCFILSRTKFNRPFTFQQIKWYHIINACCLLF